MPYDPLPEVALNAPAAPVDTFVTAQKPQDLTPNLTALTNGLSQLDSGLQDFVSERQKKQDAVDAARGEIDFHRNNSMGYDEATKQGLVPAFASQSYMQGYQRAQGALAGEDLQQKFDEQYNAAGGGNMTPDQLKAFRDQFVSNNLGNGMSPYAMEALRPKLEQLYRRSDFMYTRDHDSVVRQQQYDATGAQMNQSLQTANDEGLANKQGTNYDAAWQQLMSFRQDYVTKNSPDAADKLMIDTVASQAITNRDPKMLDLLKRNVPGTNYTFADTPYGRAKYAEAENHLVTLGNQSIARDAANQKAADKAAQDAITGQAMDMLSKNPGQPLPESVLQQGSIRDPKFREDMAKAQKVFADNQGIEDPRAILQVTQDVTAGGGRQAINEAVHSGAINKAETLDRLNKLADDYMKNRSVVDSIMADPSYKSYEKSITDHLGKAIANINGVRDTPESLSLRSQMAQAILNWATNHPGASPQDRQAAITKIGSMYLDGIKDPEGINPTYDPSAIDRGAVQQFTGPAPDSSTPFAGKGTPGARATPAPPSVLPNAPQADKPVEVDPNQVKAFQDTLTPQQMTVLQERAASQGRKPEDLVRDIYTEAVRGGHVPAAPPAAPGPQRKADATGSAPNAMAAIDSAVAPGDGPTLPPTAASYTEEDAGKARQILTDAFQPSEQDRQNLAKGFNAALMGDTAGYTPSNSYQISTLKDDARANKILDYISGPESRGNYNAYFGHAGSTKDLSQMTLSQLSSWMQNRGTESSATGRYQFMHATLFGQGGRPGLVQEMGLSGDTKFTPELQDKLALQLLNRRGYQSWKAGHMSTSAFADNLASEWASLPTSSGASKYEGDGLNHALVSRGSTEAMLHDAHSLPSNQQVATAAQPQDISGESTYPRKGQPLDTPTPAALIIHHTAMTGSPSDIVETLNKRKLGVQYVMDRDGSLYKSLPDGSRAAHILPSEVKGLELNNGNTLGVEVIARNDADVTPAQVESAKNLYGDLKQKYPGLDIHGHGYINPSHKEHTEGKTISDAVRVANGMKPDPIDGAAKIAASTAQIPVKARGFLGSAYAGGDT